MSKPSVDEMRRSDPQRLVYLFILAIKAFSASMAFAADHDALDDHCPKPFRHILARLPKVDRRIMPSSVRLPLHRQLFSARRTVPKPPSGRAAIRVDQCDDRPAR